MTGECMCVCVCVCMCLCLCVRVLWVCVVCACVCDRGKRTGGGRVLSLLSGVSVRTQLVCACV